MLFEPLYRVAHLVVHLGWVDLEFESSTVCLILPGLVGIWQERLGSWARQWNSQIPSQPNQGARPDELPCTYAPSNQRDRDRHVRHFNVLDRRPIRQRAAIHL